MRSVIYACVFFVFLAFDVSTRRAEAGFVDTPGMSVNSCSANGPWTFQGDVRAWRNDDSYGGGNVSPYVKMHVLASTTEPSGVYLEVTQVANCANINDIVAFSSDPAIVAAALTMQSDSYITATISRGTPGALSNLTVQNGSQYGVLTFGD